MGSRELDFCNAVSNVVVRDFDTICEPWDSFHKDLFTACPVDLEVQSDLLNCLSLSLSSLRRRELLFG